MSDLFVKICGLKTAHDVDTAVAAGADAVGFVFAPGSPRTVDAATALELAARVPAGVLTVGVFRGQPVDEVRRLTEESGVRGVQLHGDEGPSTTRRCAPRAGPCCGPPPSTSGAAGSTGRTCC